MTENEFPIWRPRRHVQSIITQNYRHLFMENDRIKFRKALRNSSSNFISRHDVRTFIFSRDGYKCIQCGSSENLQIDHKISVANYIDGFISLSDLNSDSNLQTLCRHCNTSKLHLYGYK